MYEIININLIKYILTAISIDPIFYLNIIRSLDYVTLTVLIQ